MAAADVFEAARDISNRLGGFVTEEVRTSILMALVALDKAEILVDPNEYRLVSCGPPKTGEAKEVNPKLLDLCKRFVYRCTINNRFPDLKAEAESVLSEIGEIEGVIGLDPDFEVKEPER